MNFKLLFNIYPLSNYTQFFVYLFYLHHISHSTNNKISTWFHSCISKCIII